MLCFQPTYKELKHYGMLPKDGGKYGFQPTYKELKLPMEVWKSI